MDFVHDQMINGLAFQVLTVAHNWTRESVLLETSFRLTSQDVILALDLAAQSRKLPASTAVNYGAEFTFLAMDDWAHLNRVSLVFTRPGKPADSGLSIHLIAQTILLCVVRASWHLLKKWRMPELKSFLWVCWLEAYYLTLLRALCI